jgi:tetratricopeptide (TPR) repeat protein
MKRLATVVLVVNWTATDYAGGQMSPGTPVLSKDGKALGTVVFPTSCDAAAQAELERGLALFHHMRYVQAEASCRSASQADPDCAMAYWGQAMTLVHPLWPVSVPPEGVSKGQALLQRARGAGKTSSRETAHIGALDAAYDWGIQVAFQRTAAKAWLAYSSGDQERGLELMKAAAEMEASTEKNPATPRRSAPVDGAHADMLLDAGRYNEAREQYEATLGRSPNRFNSLYGAGRAAELAGDAKAARASCEKLVESCARASQWEELAQARKYLAESERK